MKNGMITDEYGNHEWFLNDKLHRADGPAAEWANGTRRWHHHGQLHRDDGPAIEYADGTHMWYHYGKLHRTLGPAVEWADGTHMWYLNGVEYTFTEWLKVNESLDPKTRIIYMLRYSEKAA